MQVHCKNGVTLIRVKATLGEEYTIRHSGVMYVGKFIKVTNKGYNFLHEKSNMCIFKRHFFVPTKWQNAYQGPAKAIMVPSTTRIIPK